MSRWGALSGGPGGGSGCATKHCPMNWCARRGLMCVARSAAMPRRAASAAALSGASSRAGACAGLACLDVSRYWGRGAFPRRAKAHLEVTRWGRVGWRAWI